MRSKIAGALAVVGLFIGGTAVAASAGHYPTLQEQIRFCVNHGGRVFYNARSQPVICALPNGTFVHFRDGVPGS